MMRALFPILFFTGFLALMAWGVVISISAFEWSYLTLRFFQCSIVLACLLAVTGLYVGIFDREAKPINRPKWKNYLVGWTSIWVVTLVLFSISRVIQFTIGGIVSLLQLSQDWQSYYLGSILIMLGCFMFLMLWGMIWGKYKFQVEKVVLQLDDLPPEFNGFKIAQISDAHSGTWDDLKGVKKGIDLLQKQHADIIVFTGDMVNSDQNEVQPFIELFARLTAPFGKYAILGNHDYYGQPRERELRPVYYQQYFDKFKQMGWDLILNDHRIIRKENAAINLLGVENWGEGRYFPKRGDLDQALKGVNNGRCNILLSHDPTHWDYKVLPHHQRIHLTLSGHTHAMQFGINTPWFKWSPVKYRYKRWMGLYHEADQYLYINRGFGCLAFPGRVGMYPEITVLELKCKP